MILRLLENNNNISYFKKEKILKEIFKDFFKFTKNEFLNAKKIIENIKISFGQNINDKILVKKNDLDYKIEKKIKLKKNDYLKEEKIIFNKSENNFEIEKNINFDNKIKKQNLKIKENDNKKDKNIIIEENENKKNIDKILEKKKNSIIIKICFQIFELLPLNENVDVI